MGRLTEKTLYIGFSQSIVGAKARNFCFFVPLSEVNGNDNSGAKMNFNPNCSLEQSLK